MDARMIERTSVAWLSRKSAAFISDRLSLFVLETSSSTLAVT
jgi:hypothetical protein